MNHDTMNPKTIPVSSKVNFLKQIFLAKISNFTFFSLSGNCAYLLSAGAT